MIRFTGWGGATILGAVDSRSAEVSQPIENPEEPQQRRYDYGPGTTVGGAATLFVAGRSIAALMYEGRHIHVADGVRANHFLHWTRVDLRLPMTKQTAFGVLGEYFVRTTHFQDATQTKQSFHFPQIAIAFIWSPS
jgi:hypothetical protein